MWGLRKRFLDWDARLSDGLRVAEHPGRLRTAAALLAHSGDSWFWLLALGLVWLVDPGPWRSRASVMFAAVILTALLVLAVKFTVRRKRPQGTWGAIYRSTDPHSFPSGHAARAALLAVMAAGLGPGWLAVLLLAWAPLVSLARVAMGVHYLSDVLAGSMLGVAMGWVFAWML